MDVMLHRTGKGADERFLALRCRIDASTGLIIGTLRDATEEHRTRLAQQEAEHRYKMFIGNSSEGIWCFGLKRPMTVGLSVKQQIAWFYRYGYLQVCNDAYAVMYGFNTAEEITGIMLKDVLDRKDPKNIAYLTAFITSGYKLRETETNEQDRHGNTFTVVNNLTGTVVDGQLINAWGTQRDVTEKNRQDAALKESKESYEGLIRRLPFVVYTWRRTADGRRAIEYVSPQIKELCGISAEELIADQALFVTMIHPDDRQVFLERSLDTTRLLEPFFYECRAALVGEERWLQFQSSPRKMENGDVLWNGILRDVTERVLAQRALASSEEKYRSLIHNLNEGIWVIDAKAVTTMVNPRMASIVGAPVELIVGRPLFDFVSKDDFERTNNAIERRKKGLQESRDYTFHRPDGTRVHTTVETYPLIDGNGAYLGAVAAFMDVTEQHEAVETLRKQSEQHRFLAEASRRLAHCETDAGVYSLISEMFIALVPDSVVFVLKTSENAESSTLMEIGGIEDSIIARGAAILRYDPRGRTFKNKPGFADQFCKPNLRKFNGGLYEASTGYVPKFVARGIEKLLGVSYYYSIGISSPEEYFGYLNIMTRGPLTVEASTIEAFVHQCYLALIKIRSVRAVKEEAARRRFFFEHSSDGIGVLDKERRFVEVNKRFAEMHGYTVDEMTGLYSWDVNAEHTTRQAMERLQPGAPDTQHIMETRHRRKDGSVLDVEISFSLFSWNNEPQVYCVCRDVTERKRAAALIEQEALRRKTMMDILADGVLVIDQDHRVVECNPAICAMLGYTAEELKQLHTWDFDGVMTEEQVRREFADLKKVQGTFETHHRRKDGSTYEVEVSANGTMIGGKNFVVTICRDITERKRIEQALRTSEAQYRMLVNRIPQRVFVKDVRSNYISCNESYAADLGLPAQAIAGRNDLEFFPRELAEQYRADDRLVAESKVPLEREESYVLNGEQHTILTTKVPLFDGAGDVIGVLGIFGDITDRKKMENALRASEERFRTYLVNSPAIITIVDRDGKIAYINRAEGGSTADDLSGTNIFSNIRPEHHDEVRRCLDESIRSHTVRSYTTSAEVNGEIWWYENRVALLGGDNSELLITSINITEQKRAEEARIAVEQEIRQSEESYHGLFNTVLDAIYIQDEQGLFIDVNEGAEAIYGYSRAELIGKTPEFVSAPGLNDHLDFPVILRSVMRGANQQFEFWGRRKDGEVFPKDVRLSKGLYFGRPVIIALAQDISARKQMEQDRERQYNELHLLFSLVQDISRDQNEASIFRHAVEYLSQGLRCPKASILLFDTNGVMQFKDAVGLSDSYKAAAAGHSPWTPDTAEPEPVFVADVNDEPSLAALRPAILNEGIRALAFIPLLHERRLIGKFMIYHAGPHRFTDQESRLAQTIAQIVAQAISRSKNALELRQNKETLQNIFEALEEGVALNELVYDADGTIVDYRILEVNRAFESIALLPREKVIGRLASDIYQMPTEYITAFWKTHLHDTESIKTDLYSDLAKSWKHVSTSIPKNGRFVTSFFDITEIKNAESALRTSEQYNRSLLETSPNALAVTDLRGTIVDVNAQALRTFGFDPGDVVVGMHILDRVLPSHRAEAAERFAELLSGTTFHQLTMPMLRKDGSGFIGELNGALVRDANGASTFCLIVSSDITQRVRADEELRMSNAQLKSLIDSQTNFVVRTDMTGRYTFVNDQFCRTFGFRREELIGTAASDTYMPEDAENVDALVRKCVAQPGIAFPITLHKQLPQGGIAVTEWEFIVITDENGAPTEIQCVGHDVTEKHRAAELLRVSEERYRTVANFTYDWEMWIDENDAIQYISPSCERVCGYRPEEITADPALLTAMVHPDDRNVVAVHSANEFHGDHPHSLEYRIIHRSGEERWVNHICRPIVTDDGRKLGRRISNRDITERKLYEQQIRWSEQRYRNIVENIHQAYYEADRFAIFTYCNPGMLILSGYTEAELLGKNSFRLIVPEDRDHVKSEYRRWRDLRRHKMSLEFRVRLKNGSVLWVEQTTHFEYDEQGRFRKATNFAKDITERKTADQQLYASELRYRQITEAITDYIYTVTVDGHVVSATKHGPGCQAVTGYSVDEFERDRFLWNTMIVPEDRQMVEERIRAVLENKASQPVEHRIVRKDGVLRWVRNTLVPRYNADGALISYDGLIQDITERKTAEEGLRHSEARNRALVHTIPDIMFVQDSHGRFLNVHVPETAGLLIPPELFVNRTLEDLLQLGESIGPRPYVVQSADMPDPMRNSSELRAFVSGIIQPKLRQALASGMMQEYQYSVISGETKEYYEARLIAFDDDKILHIIRNVTGKVVYENTLRMMNEELEERVTRRTRQLTEANHELEAFSYSVSHDLRAPLRAIDSFSAMLMEGYSDRFDDEGRRLIGIVRNSIKKMDQLINGLLTLSRIGRDELHLARIEMGALVREQLQEHLSDEQRSRYSVIVGKLPACRADATLVRQAVANLITNAVKYSATVEAPVIVISGHRDGDVVRYSVKDNGVGFDASNVGKLFGIFQRLHSDDQFKGLGIGLSIVQRIIHRHGGQVSAEGQPNAGATFSFSLPAAEDTPEQEQ